MLRFLSISLWTDILAYTSEIREFCDAVIHNTPIPVGGRDGLLSVAIGLAAKKSLAEKRPVKVAEIFPQ